MAGAPFARILGTGSFLPRRVLGNAEVARCLEIDEQDIVRMSGIRNRYWASEGENCSLIAEKAARQAITRAGLKVSDIDAIILSTTSPEMPFPSTACLLQSRLELRDSAAFDIAASCTGFLYALSMADSFIRSGQFRRCLVVAAEVKSRYLNPTDAATAILFGDGAGAAVVVREESAESGILGFRIYSDGSYHDLVKVQAGGSRLPMSPETIQKGQHALTMDGPKLFRMAVKRLSASVLEFLNDEKVEIQDLKRAIFHQANARMMKAIARRLGLDPEQQVSVIEQIGNTSSASLPIALDIANSEGRIRNGDLILLGAVGGGLTWGTALIRWG